ncbi:helix-turn-helix domain-containing protein [Chryseobacterium sp. Tr-659]|uniref:helix-turn-helix domain-containing protein n=1 Tax=Chryseobacterium sp. Tr-659 TaxID=2608340 RepID=UPI0014203B12|nr:helix-turn-helix transcriptional regulator [Chryseobacterium sp. Tr-659]NIF04802.1 helix-turn-helix domain-containing protein [Chryseobacterium sp. Tr-659]
MSDQLETIEDYYRKLREDQLNMFDSDDFETGKSHFNISTRKYCGFKSPYNRRDYYKVSFIVGKGTFQYGAHQLYIDRPVLFFPSPNIPYSWECDGDQEGYFCLFNQEFFNGSPEFNPFRKTSLFKEWSKPIVFLTEEQTQLAMLYFKQMHKLNHSTYPFRCSSIKSHLASVLHLALENRVEDIHPNELPANVRLYKLFDELLNKQFPLDSPAYPLALKTPADFARHLNVHVNHLNSSVKSVTDLTTTQIIKERMFEESKNLLKYTNWDIAQIGYTLGFDQPSHFNNFFKKHAQTSPLKFKNAI